MEQAIKDVIDGDYKEPIEVTFCSFELACPLGKNIHNHLST